MALTASVLTICVAVMHSVLGGRRLITPLLERDDFPVILGNVERAKLTLNIGWHVTSLFWIGIAAVLLAIHFETSNISQVFLCMVSITFLISGLAALILSSGRHLSWIFFLPVAAITGYLAAV